LPTLAVPSEYGLVPAGSPSLGTDPHGSNIWYYNGTPAAGTFVALDYVIPGYWENRTVDLFVAGPNFGDNLGPFHCTLSGTMGSTYVGVGRGIPGIAFLGGNGEQRSYQWINSTTPSGAPDPAIILGQLAVDVVEQLIKNTPPGSPILSLAYGLSVNNPTITSLTNTSCIAPPFVQTRLTGGAFTDTAVYNATSKLFTLGNSVGLGINRCTNGNCALPGETNVLCDGALAA
jgi:5'-nucleotidase